MSKKVYIHSNTKDEYGYHEALGKLVYYGYTVVLEDSDTVDITIDKRSPNWRGWRDILSSIEWRHYDKVVALNRIKKGLDNSCQLGVQSEEDETCYT